MRRPSPVDIALGAVATFCFVILYAPLIIGAVFSIVPVRAGIADWDGATLDWYGRIWSNDSILRAIRATAIVALISVASATVLALFLAFYVEWEAALGRGFLEVLIYLPFLVPPIVTGLALLVFFAGAGVTRGLITIVIGHTVFVLAVLFRLVQTRLRALPTSLAEASADLGATRWQTFRHVLWPQLAPAVATGAILAFTLSFDETLISVFLAGDTTTLPLRLWAMMRVGFTPEINALVTLVLLLSIGLAVAVGLRLAPAGAKEEEE